jgi:hypothetical protein
MSPVFVDATENYFAQTLTPAFCTRAAQRVRTELERLLSDRALRSVNASLPEVEAEQVEPILRRSAQSVEAYMLTLASGYCRLRWLWMLRRIPHHIFSGALPSTYGYDSTIADVLSSRSTCTRLQLQLSQDQVCSYSTFGAVSTRLAEFCAAARYLAELHVRLRWAGKGSRFRLQRLGPPVPTPTIALQSAVELYDDRAISSAAPLNRGGTPLGLQTGPDLIGSAHILRIDPIEPQELPIPAEFVPDIGLSFPENEEWSTSYRFVPTFVSLEPLVRLTKLTGATSIWPHEAATILLLLRSAFIFVLQHRAGFLSLITRGYLMLTPERLRQLLDPVVADCQSLLRDIAPSHPLPLSASAFLDDLRLVSGSSWPLKAGPIIREEGPITCVDLWAATARLESALEFPVTPGSLANARAHHFELATQEVLNRSAWRPSSLLAQLRGRSLRVGGTTVTDIDAIGQSTGRLLLVSCKSLVYSADYDTGTFRTVRNASSTVIGAVKEWQEKVRYLSSNPRGDNFDFSGFLQIVPLVCTPMVIYVPLGQATQEVQPGLRAATSLRELATWLEVDDAWPWHRATH